MVWWRERFEPLRAAVGFGLARERRRKQTPKPPQGREDTTCPIYARYTLGQRLSERRKDSERKGAPVGSLAPEVVPTRQDAPRLLRHLVNHLEQADIAVYWFLERFSSLKRAPEAAPAPLRE